MLSKLKPTPPHSNILVPLYIYPFPGAWDPLHTAIVNHPNLTFTIILNPSSGPGATPLPDEHYLREIPKLYSHANARTIGYISTSWAKRDVEAVLGDVGVYAGWRGGGDGLGVNGIFLDEVPREFSVLVGRYLERLHNVIKSEKRFGEDPLVVHNPGTIPTSTSLSSNYLPHTDLTVIFEGSYTTFLSHKLSKSISSFKKASKCKRESLAVIIHGLPRDIDQKGLLKKLRGIVGEIFVTGLRDEEGCYANFWGRWGEWVDDMASS